VTDHRPDQDVTERRIAGFSRSTINPSTARRQQAVLDHQRRAPTQYRRAILAAANHLLEEDLVVVIGWRLQQQNATPVSRSRGAPGWRPDQPTTVAPLAG